jgi:hypothetical protein
MSFNYITNIPFATHNPSTDQPNMQINTNATNDIIGVDHVTFNTANGGTHNKMTLTNAQPDPGLLMSQAQIYPKTFGSSVTYLEPYFASNTSANNQINGYLPFVKCMGRFVTSSGPYPATLTVPANTLSVNIASVNGIVQTAANSVTVTFATALPYNTYYIFGEGLYFLTGSPITKNTTSIVFLGVSSPNQTVGFMVI